MKTLIRSFVILALIGLCPIEMFAWEGMPTPPLHVEGRFLKDPTGKNVILHGWMQPTSNYFNGRFFHDPVTFTPEDVEVPLNVYKSIVDLLSDTNPLFGSDHGWYNSFVRIWTPSDSWTNQGTCDTALQNRAWENMYIPYVEHCKSRGIYVVFVGNTPDGGTFMGAQHKSNMIKFWTRICNRYPAIKNADNVMFEICNEPVNIESVLGNGNWGSVSDAHDRAVQAFFQDIVDSIRATGANNVIWVPGLIWQDRLMNFATYPISGENIGYAGHMYPFGSSNLNDINNRFVSSGWKACSDKYPIIVTEGSWHTMGNQGIRTGTTEVFGNAVRSFYDTQGNISWLCGMTEELIGNMGNGISGFTYPEINSGRAGFHWWPSYTWCAPDDGTPEFRFASVTDNNPKQIQVIVSHPARKISNFDGFTVKIDNQVIGIDSIVMGDSTNQLVINLTDSILNDNNILFSYNNGNVVSIYEKDLTNFNDEPVNNLLKGAAPKIVELNTSKDGDTLVVKFNMKMKLPSDISALTLEAEDDGNTIILSLQSAFLDNDSSTLLFSLSEKVYAHYQLLLSYSGNNIVSSDSALLKFFSGLPVSNHSDGLPVQIISGNLKQDGMSGILTFSKSLTPVIGKSAEFNLKVNGKSVSFTDFFNINDTIIFSLATNLHYGDTATISYTPGNITANDGGILEGFSDIQLTNLMIEPEWVSIPNKIEAENYYLQWGIQTENTNDAGGGLNIGWIDDGDWMEYAIENNTSETNYEIVFRVASPNTDSKLDYYLDNKRVRSVAVPRTGGWQTWQSVVKDITVSQGRHYLKILVTKGGFNFNYIDIREVGTDIRKINDDKIKIYPNPVSTGLTIVSADFRYNKVEIIDIMGNTVLSRLTASEPELVIPVDLPNGVYIVKISNDKQFQLKKIIIDNN